MKNWLLNAFTADIQFVFVTNVGFHLGWNRQSNQKGVSRGL